MTRRLLLAAVLCAACDHRVAEPEPALHTTIATAVPIAPATTPATTTAARCIVATPAEPARPDPPKGPDPRCPPDPTGPPKLRRGSVRVSGLDATVNVELAERDADRMRGLMYRKRLPETEGMLFVFEDEEPRAFWMHNTCVPLDMLFVASDGVIVGIQQNVPTLNDDSYRPGDCAARYVLEVNAGWARRHGVKAGQKLLIDGL